MAIWDRLPPSPGVADYSGRWPGIRTEAVERIARAVETAATARHAAANGKALMRAVAPRVQDIEASNHALAYRFGRK